MDKSPPAATGPDTEYEVLPPADTEPDTEDTEIRWMLDQIRYKLIVMSGKGGVGKTSVAVALALTLARRGFTVGLMDADLHGPDVFRMLGLGLPMDLFHAQYNLPPEFFHNLKVVSIEAMMKDREAAIIWRGAIKHKIIRQFLTEVNWGPLDFLVIDCPPGTGDEPLSIALTIPEAQAVLVTTPQEISLSDVRRSMQFCHKINLPILGVVENMDHVVCPNCARAISLFRSVSGTRSVASLGLNLLGSLPFDSQVVAAADAGRLLEFDTSQSPFFQAFNQVTDSILAGLGRPEPLKNLPSREPGLIKLAIPVSEGKLSNQFRQNQEFALISVKDGRIIDQTLDTPPDFKAGVLPAWLDRQGVTHLIVAQMKDNARKFFQRKGIEVIFGSPDLTPEALVEDFLAHQPPVRAGQA